MATIATVHDLAGAGRCSLTTAISVLSALGHHCCPIPTAILSQPVDFPNPFFLDFTPYLPDYLNRWQKVCPQPDMLYSGFLGSPEQPLLLAGYLEQHPDIMAIVDPVMADGGELYPCYDTDFVAAMGVLASKAHLLTPNPTEFLLLAGEAPDTPFPDNDSRLLALASRLNAPRLTHLVITGVPDIHSEYRNLILEPATAKVHRIPCRHTGVAFTGSGDLFASIVCGCVAGGLSLESAVEAAGSYLTQVAELADPKSDPRLGMPFETHLADLCRLTPKPVGTTVKKES